MTESERKIIIRSLLATCYPDASIALSYRTPWELLVSVILSAQCTDKMVNTVTPGLFIKYPTIGDFARADQAELEKDIRKTGFFRMKAKHIREAAHRIIDRYGGIVPKRMADLITIPGVARKTANVVQSNAYGAVEGIAVDTHVLRISQRLRLVPIDAIGGKRRVCFQRATETVIDYVKDADPVKIEESLMKTVSQSDWMKITYQIIEHGRAVCKAIRPECSQCPLSSYCPVSRQ